MVEFDDGDISGRFCFYDRSKDRERYTESKVALLSHGIYVMQQNSYFIEEEGGMDFPNFFGYVNCDDLNVITSRNNFRKDEKYKEFVKKVRKKVSDYVGKLCKEVNENKDKELGYTQKPVLSLCSTCHKWIEPEILDNWIPHPQKSQNILKAQIGISMGR